MDAHAEKTPPPSLGAVKNLRTALRILSFVVFLGILLIWVMKPTNIYGEQWTPEIRAHTARSTYFGPQGSNLLLCTFPLLFAGIVGSIYVHLGQKMNDTNIQSKNEKKFMHSLRQPVIVQAPLGIVSGIELAFFTMFLALLVWPFSMYVHKNLEETAPKEWQSNLEIIGSGMNIVGTICLVVLFFPVTRGSSILPLFGLNSESSIKYHMWVGHITMFSFTLHGLAFLICWISNNEYFKLLEWSKQDVSIVAGEVSLLAGLILWVTTITSIRRKMFELFFYTHYLYIIFIVFYVLHVGVSHAFQMIPGFYLFIVDRYLRFLQSRKRVSLVSTRVLPSEFIELNFAKCPCLAYNPTSTLFINVPSISKLQWHPFTVTSSSSFESDKISVVIKVDGHWTRKLYHVLSSPSLHHLEVSVEGPYGPSSTNFLRYDTLLLVSGGSGITPFISIIRELIFMRKTLKCKTPNVILVPSFKHSADIAVLDFLLPASSFDISDLNIQIEAYVTRETHAGEDNSKQLAKTFLLKPLPTDSAVSAVLGPNSWLWLGTIIASSFAIFLVLIGLITGYYIYPIDHNSDEIYPSSARSAIYMLAMLFSIVVAASAAFFCTKEAKPAISANGSSSDADRELESLPSQSLVQAANVHYGERPNLKRILSEVKGESIGVLASGPKTLRHDVAALCSSGMADNVSFQSISFSW